MNHTLILGNQLFQEWITDSRMKPGKKDKVLMIEDCGVASMHRYHRLRLLHTFVSMREFRDELVQNGIEVDYFEIADSVKTAFYPRILKQVGKGGRIRTAEIVDRSFRKEMQDFCTKHGITLEELPSPQFLSTVQNFKDYMGKSKKPFMKTFYERERKRLGILVNSDGEPDGGKWSFDSENRQKFPKDFQEPPTPSIEVSRHEKAVRKEIEKHFDGFPGEMGELYLPCTRKDAMIWLKAFVKDRLDGFGPVEDAISARFEIANHSLLAPLINIGLLSPTEVVEETLKFAKKNKSSLQSVEGFLRQIIGWREFVRGIDAVYGDQQAESNFFKHEGKLTKAWYEGKTGIPPLDDAIRKVNRLGYLHHIERLMIVSNLMLLCEVHPKEVYRWFMEMHLDSYEWVMGPNVYGMGQMSDGGIFATKPYISGSNYILKMSDYAKGDWCAIWDGLYWSFIDKHRAFFLKNPRLSMMVRLLDKMPDSKKKPLFKAAADFKKRVVG
jgi:deoxyribodipyrimidine photolyase-related protein